MATANSPPTIPTDHSRILTTGVMAWGVMAWPIHDEASPGVAPRPAPRKHQPRETPAPCRATNLPTPVATNGKSGGQCLSAWRTMLRNGRLFRAVRDYDVAADLSALGGRGGTGIARPTGRQT